MFQHKAVIEFGIIGLGRFGFALAKTLADSGKEVLVIDNNESKIKQIRNVTDNAFFVDQLTKEAMEEAGVQNCSTVIVCIGEKIDVSVLTTLNVISMGVPRVIAKAISPEQGSVLEKIGAEVVYPESDMAIRLGNSLMSSRALDFISLSDDFTIAEIKLTDKISGHTIKQADLRKKFSLNIIAVEHNSVTTIELNPDMMLEENDLVVVVGKSDNITRFERFLMGQR